MYTLSIGYGKIMRNFMKTFEDYLKQIHDKQYRGISDNAPDDYENWVSNMGADEFIEYSSEYKAIRIKEIDEEILEMSKI